MRELNSATVVITGAGSGIGRHLALQLAQRGSNLAISDVDQTGLDETLSLIAHRQGLLHSQILDVANKHAMFEYAEALKEKYTEVNVLINNAGVGLNTGTLEQTDVEEFEWLMSINFFGVLYGTKAFLPLLSQASWGHIVNVSSLFGLIGAPGQSAYNASKFAVRGMTEALRQELEMTHSRVSCTTVHPGGVKTNIARNSRGPRQSEEPQTDLHNALIDNPDDFEKIAKTTPESAAEQIINAIERNKRRVLVGADAKLLDWIQRHFPNHYQRVFRFLKNALST